VCIGVPLLDDHGESKIHEQLPSPFGFTRVCQPKLTHVRRIEARSAARLRMASLQLPT
jgi:hypothetical protein